MPTREPCERKTWLTTPAPIKRLFARFPLVTYPENSLPDRTHLDRTKTNLFVFDTPHSTINKDLKQQPSFNPSCLKWQTYLLFSQILFVTHPSTNHASPTGSLPFLLPSDSLLPIPSTKLEQWTRDNTPQSDSIAQTPIEESKLQVYPTLISQSIRRAWLYTLYLDAAHAETLTSLYITPSSSNSFIRAVLAYQLRAAATAELLNAPGGTNVIDVERIYRNAERALETLSTLLGEREWFSQCEEKGAMEEEDKEEGEVRGVRQPGMFDAEVFAYTYLVLDERIGMGESRLARGLKRWENLIGHRERIVERYWI